MVYAVVRLRGTVHINDRAKRTLELLKLGKKHNCVLIPETRENLGMIKKVQNIVTWGEAGQDMISNLILKRGRLPGNKRITTDYIKEKLGKDLKTITPEIMESKIKVKDIPGLKSTFRLHPPSKGLERKGMKKPYSMGGSFGYRGKDIDSLLKRMI